MSVELLKTALTELTKLIADKNSRLRRNIQSNDLDDPDYHDYQTCYELEVMINKLEGK